jgi:Tfp pilus assembly protein PilV
MTLTFRPLRAQRGTSLVEAVVALAVMAFGMLAVVGVQSMLRLNADVAKQRSEAVRIAQDAMEDARAFAAIEAPLGGQSAFADIASAAGVVVDDRPGTNTSYTLTRTVVERNDPRRKEISIRVAWTDRSDQAQAVELNSIIAAIDPRVALLLVARPNGIPPRLPNGRSPAVPPAAVSLPGTGKSAFLPPAQSRGLVWLLDDTTGVITSVCSFPGTDLSQLVPATQCASAPSYLISGFVRFAPVLSPDAAAPAGTQIPWGMFAIALGDAFADGECFAEPVADQPRGYTAYYCRVPQSADTTWSGSTLLGPPLDLGLHDTCRYVNDAAGNAGHPLVYVRLDHSLANQNFLVVDQGVACPAGTQPHQPPP